MRFKSVFALKGYLFGGVKLAKNADPVKYVYTGYGIGFDSRSEFHYLTLVWVKCHYFCSGYELIGAY